uniref:Retrotransposon gag domain-containing protein n=1 Tax=Lactuca sativa TaxID=4236 RepID=A0A9R1UEZ6_LACSA|nr:hypothetical protein LSAT_V11C900459030 [Lactuca sativa]
MSENGDDDEKTLREWATQEVTRQPLCITFLEAQNFKLKYGLIHLLPPFRGLENEDSHKFLKEFLVVCSGMKPHAVTEDQIKLRAFPFSVQDAANEWLYDLPSGSITSWNKLAKLFLEKYFPEDKVSHLHREIFDIKQWKREAFHTYWEQFKKLLRPQQNFQQRNQYQTPPGFQHPFQQNQHQNNFQQPHVHPQASSSNMSLEYIVKSFATSNQALQNETESSLKNLEQQVSQLAKSMSKLEAQTQGKFSSQTEKNPKNNACVVTLRSGINYKGTNQ